LIGWQQRRRETGSIAPRRQTRWRTPVLAPHLAQLEGLIQAQPDRTFGELQAALGTSACVATIWRTVKQIGFTLKKKVRASEQDRPDVTTARCDWQHVTAGIDPARLVFLDEGGVATDLLRRYS
jgi:transposase